MRDITLEDTFRHQFTTRAFATGIPTVLAGTPVLSVLEENNATPITAGVSVSVDRASVGGLNEATIVATAANGYEAGKSYAIYISTGTVGGVSVIGEIVGHFTIGLSAAAIDLANATDGLGALKALIDTIDTVVDAIKAVTDLLPDAGALTTIGADTARLTAARAAVLTDWINGGRLDLLLDAIPTTAMRGTDGALTDKAGFSLSTAGILAVWHQALTAIVTAGRVGKLLKDEITSARMATLTDWINGGRLDLILDAILLDTGELQTDDVPGLIAALNDLSAAQVNTEVVDVLKVDTITLPGQVAPPLTPTFEETLAWVFKILRNRKRQTATLWELMADDETTVDAKATVSDDGTTAIKQEIVAGP